MTSPNTGEIFKYHRSGGLFEVKKVTKEFVILYAQDGSSQIMSGRGSFDWLFARVSPMESAHENLNSGAK